MNDILAAALRWIWAPILVALAAGGWFTQEWWQPTVQGWIDAAKARQGAPAGHEEHDAGHDDHGHDDHAHGAGDADSIELSEQARKNIGLQLVKVELRPYDRTIAVPGIVVERPGRSIIEITAPVTGIVTQIVPIEGQAVEPGQRLFEIRLTHEEIVQAQAEFLRAAEELDVIRKEVDRLQGVVNEGAVAGRVLLERKYEMQKQEAILRSQRQALLLHGLLPKQVDDILATRNLLSALTVLAPDHEELPAVGQQSLFQVQHLKVERGQHVVAGQQLAVLTDHAELYIEGNAFEQDVAEIHRALAERASITAVLETKGSEPIVIKDLKILYVAGDVDAAARTFRFYVPLHNEQLLAEVPPSAGQPAARRFVNWRYKPGQRMQLLVTVEQWPDRIVLPVEAVAQEGAEAYVFLPNGKKFERRAVHVEYRDPLWVVIANDGVLFPGETVVARGANQLQLALKNQSGGAIDPHAGHSH